VHVFLIEGLVLFLFLLIGTALRRRAFFGFASLLVGAWLVQIKALTVLGIAYVGLGMWLVVKGMRSTRGKRSGRRTWPRAQPKQRRSLKGDKVLASRAAPKPNKRYTPPKPPRRTPPKKPAPVRAETPSTDDAGRKAVSQTLGPDRVVRLPAPFWQLKCPLSDSRVLETLS